MISNSDQEIIPIVFISDKQYVMPTCVAITSLIYNMNSATKYDVFVITVDCSKESLKRVKRLETENCKINIIRKNVKKYKDIKQLCTITLACLLKFDICDIVFNYDKIIYLDSDTIVNKDLSNLLHINLEDNYLAGVNELNYVGTNTNRINGGVLVFNAKKMREEKMSEKLIQKRRELGDRESMDQQTFNLMFKNKIKFLDVGYNCLPELLFGKYKITYPIKIINKKYQSSYISKYEIVKQASILHFAASNKPWKDPFCPFSYIWFFYFEKSSYKNNVKIKRLKFGYMINKMLLTIKEEGLSSLISRVRGN